MRKGQAGFKPGPNGETPADLLSVIGPTLLVDIGIRSRAPVGDRPDLHAKSVWALIDTGAGGDCIDDELAQGIGLPITEEGWMSGVGGRHRAYVYTGRLYVPSLDRLLFQRFTGVKLGEGDQRHRVILGRSFLRRYRLAYDGPAGSVELIED